eukprot:7377071-Lingulodinium_polyedra.AAC.1
MARGGRIRTRGCQHPSLCGAHCHLLCVSLAKSPSDGHRGPSLAWSPRPPDVCLARDVERNGRRRGGL